MNEQSKNLLDAIELKDGKTLIGIVDYISSKQLYFFDFTQDTDVDYLLLAILWKGNNPGMRFSVYCTINYPTVQLPRAILVPISNIQRAIYNITTKKPKQRKRNIRLKSASQI
jgi:hypothetical protein